MNLTLVYGGHLRDTLALQPTINDVLHSWLVIAESVVHSHITCIRNDDLCRRPARPSTLPQWASSGPSRRRKADALLLDANKCATSTPTASGWGRDWRIPDWYQRPNSLHVEEVEEVEMRLKEEVDEEVGMTLGLGNMERMVRVLYDTTNKRLFIWKEQNIIENLCLCTGIECAK